MWPFWVFIHYYLYVTLLDFFYLVMFVVQVVDYSKSKKPQKAVMPPSKLPTSMRFEIHACFVWLDVVEWPLEARLAYSTYSSVLTFNHCTKLPTIIVYIIDTHWSPLCTADICSSYVVCKQQPVSLVSNKQSIFP